MYSNKKTSHHFQSFDTQNEMFTSRGFRAELTSGWFDNWPRTLPIDQRNEQSAAQLAVELLQKVRNGTSIAVQ